MSVGRRSELWAHFYPCYLDRSGKYYRCMHCGEIVHSSDRRNHLRYKHKEIWEKMRRKLQRDAATVHPGGVV